MKNRIIFLSHVIDVDTPSYGNRDKFLVEQISEIKQRKSATSSKWTFTSNHLGTHVDVPKHFFAKGKTITDYKPEFWIFNKIQIVDIPCNNSKIIKIEDIPEEININTELLLIRTGYEKYRLTQKYWADNPGLSSKLGIWLRKNYPKVKVVGFDFISLTSWKHRSDGKIAHQAFLNPEREGKPICIIEDMNLQLIKSKIREVLVAPLFVENCDGSPVTVFAQI